jgi:hypothetical protein
MTGLVECHSGYTYAERPTALTWQGQRYAIVEILSQGLTPQTKWFRVRTADGQSFELTYIEASGAGSSGPEWHIHQL